MENMFCTTLTLDMPETVERACFLTLIFFLCVWKRRILSTHTPVKHVCFFNVAERNTEMSLEQYYHICLDKQTRMFKSHTKHKSFTFSSFMFLKSLTCIKETDMFSCMVYRATYETTRLMIFYCLDNDTLGLLKYISSLFCRRWNSHCILYLPTRANLFPICCSETAFFCLVRYVSIAN